MQFLRENQGKAIRVITDRLCSALHDGKRVLWLVSGGSNVAAEVETMRFMREHCDNYLNHLAILPMDERYGTKGHAGSNTQLLREAGFDPGTAVWVDVLEHNVPFEETVSFYNDVATTALDNASVVIGQFGMGDNGHVAGVQPGSVAISADEVTVTGFEWTDFARMTLTPSALKRITTGYLLAYGQNKKAVLERLQANDEPVSELPAVLLYDIPEMYVYNDQIGEKREK